MGFKKGNGLYEKYGFKKGNIPWNKGKKTPQWIKERTKLAIEKCDNFGMRGKHHSEETKNKIREKHKGIKRSEETKLKQSLSTKGISHSKEWNNKVSIALKGKKKSKEHIENIIKYHSYQKGKTYEEIFGKDKAKNIKDKLSKKLSLENNPRWMGGIAYEPYDNTFNEKFKRSIRKRDNQVCMLCRIHREKLYRTLDVHHINYDKLLSIKENCISLCLSCHTKTNSNREHWTKFFQSLLSERYGYKYSENLEPILNI